MTVALEWKQLLQRMEREPVVDVLGVVSPKGVGGGQVPPETARRLRLELTAWRAGEGPLETVPLRGHRQVTQAELSRLVREISPFMVVRFRARLLRASPEGGPSCLLEDLPEPERNDPELDAWARKSQEPVTFDEPTLGTFTLDRRIDHYVAKARWCGTPVDLHLEAQREDELRLAREAALALWSQQEAWSERSREFAADELLDRKNDDWPDEDDEGNDVIVSRSDFVSRMTLDGVTVRADRGFELWYRDGGLFDGHGISVWGDLDRGPVEAEIVG